MFKPLPTRHNLVNSLYTERYIRESAWNETLSIIEYPYEYRLRNIE